MSKGDPPRSQPSGNGQPPADTEYGRFETMLKRLLKVPKEEIKRREERERAKRSS